MWSGGTGSTHFIVLHSTSIYNFNDSMLQQDYVAKWELVLV